MINPDEVLKRTDEIAQKLQREEGRTVITGIRSTQIAGLCQALVEAINEQPDSGCDCQAND